MTDPHQRRDFWLFGTPIAHSLSPLVHNTVFESLELPHRYRLCDTARPEDGEMLKLIHAPTFGGAAVTMPLKVVTMRYLDDLEQAAREIGSINTIIVRHRPGDDKPFLVGQNYDWEGIRNSFLHAIPQGVAVDTVTKGKCGFIIGGGGTTRAGVFAFAQLGLSPIFLINRDPKETEEIIGHFPQYDLRALSQANEWTDEWQGQVAMGLGAIPSFEPVTEGEKNVYAIADRILGAKAIAGRERIFLDMCYKPRDTILLKMARNLGWTAIDGLEPMVEQGLAQSRAWLLDERSLSSPYGGKRTALGEAEANARAKLMSIGDGGSPTSKL